MIRYTLCSILWVYFSSVLSYTFQLKEHIQTNIRKTMHVKTCLRRSFLCFAILIISRSLALDLWDTLYCSKVSTTVSKRMQRTTIIIDWFLFRLHLQISLRLNKVHFLRRRFILRSVKLVVFKLKAR